MRQVGILASHNGSTFKRLQEAILNGELKGFKVVVVISNNTNATVLESAKSYGIKTQVINQKTDKHPDEALMKALNGCDIILLSGYMKKLSPKLVNSFFIINSHPALLPKYGGEGMYGRFVHEAIIKNGDNFSGVTFHKIDEEYDKGEIFLQKKIPLDKQESVESLESKIKKLEQESIVELFSMI